MSGRGHRRRHAAIQQQQKRNVFFNTLVLGFNSGQYDLILIKKKPFVAQIPQESDVKLAKKQNKVMYRSTATFLKICCYISPGTGHEK